MAYKLIRKSKEKVQGEQRCRRVNQDRCEGYTTATIGARSSLDTPSQTIDLKFLSKPVKIALPLYRSLAMLAISTLEHLGVFMGVRA